MFASLGTSTRLHFDGHRGTPVSTWWGRLPSRLDPWIPRSPQYRRRGCTGCSSGVGKMWFPVPGMSGGFTAHLAGGKVEVMHDSRGDSSTTWLRPVAADSTACIKD